jgi:hypothetical protein
MPCACKKRGKWDAKEGEQESASSHQQDGVGRRPNGIARRQGVTWRTLWTPVAFSLIRKSGRVVPNIVFHGDRDTTVNPRNGDHVITRSMRTTNLLKTVHRGRVQTEGIPTLARSAPTRAGAQSLSTGKSMEPHKHGRTFKLLSPG